MNYKNFKDIPHIIQNKYTSHNTIALDKEELMKVLGLMNGYSWLIEKDVINKEERLVYTFSSQRPKSNHRIKIWKYEDEWYIYDTPVAAYLCDQFYSLTECINDNILN